MPFSIAQVTPFPWEAHHEVNTFVERVSDELCARGHRVLVVAPSRSRELVRDSRRLIRSAKEDPEQLFEDGGVRVLGAGEVLRAERGRSGTLAMPLDVARTIEELLGIAPLDFVHVHEPFAPSASSAALRHSRALNVGTFHAPTERVLSTQVARRFVEFFFGRLDARTASYQATADLMARFFPADYRVVAPGADTCPGAEERGRGPVRILFCADEEERPALRLFLRALRRLPDEPAWEAAVWTAGGEPATGPGRTLRERVGFVGPREGSVARELARSDVVVCASTGVRPAPGFLTRVVAAGAIPIAARLPVYEEVLAEGELGLTFEPGDVDTLAAQLERLVADEPLRARLRTAGEARREQLTWSRAADEIEDVYAGVAARRRTRDGDGALRARLAGRPLIDVDLHMHTDHSHDCATPVEVLLATAREQGLGAIAVTDHNEISGALEAREKARGIKVIVAEEIKTAHQGEVIGLFLQEKIPRGMSMEETIAEIKRQGGLVYVPHPFDRLHAVPDYQHLLSVLDQVDAIEVFNPRVAFTAFNEEAARFAAKYRIPAGAGSDSHVAQGLGSVRIKMRDFDGPEEFLESLRDADIVQRPTSLVYVQALKFLQTKATPAPARRAARARRVRRAARNS